MEEDIGKMGGMNRVLSLIWEENARGEGGRESEGKEIIRAREIERERERKKRVLGKKRSSGPFISGLK